MKALTPNDKVYSFAITGRVGEPEYGISYQYGSFKYGKVWSHRGIWQRRFIKKDERKGIQYVKMKYYKPSNPQTPLQQANRQKLANATALYKSLKNQGFFDLVKWPRIHEMSLYNRVISRILKKNPSIYGYARYGGSKRGQDFIL